MKDEIWNWNGARWWKVDFHAHTPASEDYGKGPDQDALKQRSPRNWLLDFMRAEIDCVAVTDHNTGAWIDELKEALSALREERPTGFRDLHLFPGVEMTVQGGIHLLAIFDEGKNKADIDQLLGAAGFDLANRDEVDAVSSKSFREIVDIVTKQSGIAIAAHVDKPRGLWRHMEGGTLERNLSDCPPHHLALEVVDEAPPPPGYFRQLCVQKRWEFARVVGSDSHHPDGDGTQSRPGSRFTWVKMDTPSIEGLRLALVDRELSLERVDASRASPPVSDRNSHATNVIEELEVVNALHLGAGGRDFRICFNPWMNAIIGGRGTGKSTLVEFLRLVLRRSGELPEGLKAEYEKYQEIRKARSDRGLLTANTRLRVVYRKDGARFRITWHPAGASAALPPIEEWVEGEWKPVPGDVQKQYPVRIYSQGQILSLAEDSQALLGIVDDDPEVGHEEWKAAFDRETGRYLEIKARRRELESRLREEPRLQGELADVARKLRIFERSDHAAVLRSYQQRVRESRVVEVWEEQWANLPSRLVELAETIVPPTLMLGESEGDAEGTTGILASAAEVVRELGDAEARVRALAREVESIREGWLSDSGRVSWQRRVAEATAAFEKLKTLLSSESVGDPAAYGELVARRQTLETRLLEVAGLREQLVRLDAAAAECLARIESARTTITDRRKAFLAKVLQGNPHVRIDVEPFGARDDAEYRLRRVLGKDDGSFTDSFFGPIIGRLYPGAPESGAVVLGRLREIKADIRSWRAGDPESAAVDKRFLKYLQSLPPEICDRLDCEFPEDLLVVSYGTPGSGDGFRPVTSGSPGQRSAALLAFLVSYGEAPLVLDQPEDDLDNHLIYELVVAQLRTLKRRRQIIVVTHNANIVVNGDAELVVALKVCRGRTEFDEQGSLQSRKVREVVCKVMEGGKTAFEDRFRRIMLEPSRV